MRIIIRQVILSGEDMRRQLLKEIVDETDIEIQDENEFLMIWGLRSAG